jgi:hypothetical protein
MDRRALNLLADTMPRIRFVVVHDAVQVAAVLAAAAEFLPQCAALALVSAPGAARYLSPRLFLAMTGPPLANMVPVLDCGRAPGHALAAIRAGCPALVLAPCPAFAAVEAAAREAGAWLWPVRPPALDMATLRPGHPRDDTRLRGWLSPPADPASLAGGAR